MSGFHTDLRYAIRLYRRTPPQSLIAILIIAIAIAFAIAFFRLYDDLALQGPRGFRSPSDLVGIGLSNASSLELRLPGRLRRAVVERSHAVEMAATLVYVDNQVTVDGKAVLATSGIVSEDFFDGLGVRMHIGTGLTPTRLGSAIDRAAVLDYRFWQRHYGGNPSVLGRQIGVGKASFTIVGVTHPDFRGTRRGRGADVWFSLAGFAKSVWNAQPHVILDRFRMITIGRLAPDQSVATARRELQGITQELRAQFRDDLLGLQLVILQNLAPDPQRHANAVRQVQLLTMVAVLLAFIAATNLSLFFLARAPGRQREMGIRLASGATPYRLMRQLLTESTGLIVTGVVLRLIAHVWLTELLRSLPSLRGIEWLESNSLDWKTYAFVGCLVLLVSAAVAGAPLLNLARHSVAERMHRKRGSMRSQRLIVGVQIGIATLVLFVTCLFIESLIRSSHTPVGYESSGVTVVKLTPTDDRLPSDLQAASNFRRIVSERLGSMALVDRVGFGSALPAVASPDTYLVEVPGSGDTTIASRVARVSPGWIQALQIRLLRGQLPAHVNYYAAVISRRFAELAWGNIDVVGKEIRAPIEFSASGGVAKGLTSLRVVAVTEDLQLSNPGDLVTPVVLVNKPATTDLDGFVLVKGWLDSADIEAALNETLRLMTPRLEITEINALDRRLDRLSAPERARATVTGVAGVFTAILTVLGFFGVLRFMVGNARFELGLRSPLGADPKTLRNHFFRQSIILGLPGLMGGLLVSAVALPFVSQWFELRQVGSVSSLACSGVILSLLMSIFVWFPAVQAGRAEPAAVLKTQ